MAPGYRTATTTRRGNRSGYPEHDDFEGLPVRQWRMQEVDIAPPPVPTTTQKNDRWSVELPHGMPKDYHLLPPHSQELLRAARSGALYKRKAPPEEDDVAEVVDILPAGTGGKTGTVAAGPVADAEKGGDKRPGASKADPGIKVKVWRRLPRDAEAPPVSHLAKRHKNTITLPSKASTTQFSGPTVTRVTVRRADAAGNSYEQTITINDDEQLNHLDGEIVSTTLIPAPTALDPAAQQQATPTRKRPPPPPHKKKHKGPGRGRKKKLIAGPLPLPAKPGVAPNTTAAPMGTTEPNTKTPVATDAPIKQEDNTGTPDVEMAENSAIASDEEEGEDDEGDEGDEGEVNEEGGNEGQGDDAAGDSTEQGTPHDDQDQEMEDADDTLDIVKPSSIEEPTGHSRPVEGETEVIDTAHTQQQPPNPLNLGASHLGMSHLFSPRQHEGSPLKNVVLQSPTEPRDLNFPDPPAQVNEQTAFGTRTFADTEGVTQVAETTQIKKETTASGPAVVEMSAQVTSVSFESATQTANSGSTLPSLTSMHGVDSIPSVVGRDSATFKRLEVTHDFGGDRLHKPNTTSSSSQQTYHATASHSLLPSLRESPKVPTLPALPPMMRSRPAPEEDGLDLLGGLERELDRQSRTSSAAPGGSGQPSSAYTNTPAENASLTRATGGQPSSEENDRLQERGF